MPSRAQALTATPMRYGNTVRAASSEFIGTLPVDGQVSLDLQSRLRLAAILCNSLFPNGKVLHRESPGNRLLTSRVTKIAKFSVPE
jgi:hypothetical protein